MDTETIITSIITLLAVWFGFFLSNTNNDKLEKKEKIKKIEDLQHLLNLVENYIIAYDESIGRENILENIPCIQPMDIPFSIKLQEYSFLTDYNIHFLSLLDVISRQNNQLHNLVNHYINSIKSYIDIYYTDESQTHKERSKKDLERTYNYIKDAIRGLRILIVIFNKTVHSSILCNYNILCNSRLNGYCQSLSFENIFNFEEHQLYKNWIKIIEEGKVNPPNFKCFVCNVKNKIINFFKQIEFYFTYKPINCHKNIKKK